MNIYCCRVLDQTWKFAKFRSVKNKASSKRLLYMCPDPLAARQRWRDAGCCKVSIFCNKNHCGLKLSDLNLILHDTCTEPDGRRGNIADTDKKGGVMRGFPKLAWQAVFSGVRSKEKICPTYFEIHRTYFKIQGTYFFPYNFWSFSMGNSMVKKLVFFGYI